MDADAFWMRAEPELNTGCWLWAGAANEGGYGKLRLAGQTWRANRAAWVLANGSIPEGLIVCHRCDTPACVNPGHLFLGTHHDNMADKVAKGRARTGAGTGERSPCATITDALAAEIRRLSDDGLVGPQIAARFGASIHVVRQIARRATWTHLPGLRGDPGNRCNVGERNRASRLVADQVRTIRESRASNKALAATYGVSTSAIRHVRARTTWGHI